MAHRASDPPSSASRPHDHRRCVSQALGAAAALASARKLRFTRRRREVLEIVSGSHRPLGAYEVLAALAAISPREKPKPPTVYRALEFLLANGFVHRIDSRNAFIACFRPQREHRAHFLLCDMCGSAVEVAHQGLSAALQACAKSARFAVSRETVELVGRCRSCRSARSRRHDP